MHATAAWVHEVVTGPLPDSALLPVLERDGRTVRIESNRDYQRIFDNWLWRGVLPVRAKGAYRKGRSTLRFNICGLELNIALKARVRSAQGGVIVFAIQEIDRHRQLLASLARDMPLLI